MFDYQTALENLAQCTVLCVGDLMLDDFVYGEVTRISPEAPTPVLAVKHNTIEIGGAGNVARNIAALGATCIFVGLIGEDEAGLTLRKALTRLGAVVAELVIDKTRPTTRKVRFVSEHHSTHLMRADWETAAPASAESQSAIIAHAEAAMPKVGAVVLSDYAKGVLTERVIRAIIDAARRNPYERRFRTAPAGLAPVSIAKNSLVIYSVGLGQTSNEPSGEQSLFVTELIKELRSPGISADEAFARTRIDVSRASDADQVPWVASSLVEGFYFVPSGGPAAARDGAR